MNCDLYLIEETSLYFTCIFRKSITSWISPSFNDFWISAICLQKGVITDEGVANLYETDTGDTCEGLSEKGRNSCLPLNTGSIATL